MIKKIGIPGWVVENKTFGLTLPYIEYFRKFGQVIILCPDDPIREDLDLLVLPGGLDVNPSRQEYNKLSMYTGVSNPMLEYFDTHALSKYVEQEQPILGICRGAQSLWINFGGELIQHNYWHIQSDYSKDEVHKLFWNAQYGDEYRKLVDKVNSRHHQTMSTFNYTPENIIPLAWAVEGKGPVEDIVEVFKHKSLPIYGVQYHPEDCPTDCFTPRIIRNLLEVKQNEVIEEEML